MWNWKLFTLAGIVATGGILAWGAAGGQVQTSTDWNGSIPVVSDGVAPNAELVLQGNRDRYSVAATESGSFHFGASRRGSYKLTVSLGGRLFRMATSITIPVAGSSIVTLLADRSIAPGQRLAFTVADRDMRDFRR